MNSRRHVWHACGPPSTLKSLSRRHGTPEQASLKRFSDRSDKAPTCGCLPVLVSLPAASRWKQLRCALIACPLHVCRRWRAGNCSSGRLWRCAGARREGGQRLYVKESTVTRWAQHAKQKANCPAVAMSVSGYCVFHGHARARLECMLPHSAMPCPPQATLSAGRLLRVHALARLECML